MMKLIINKAYNLIKAGEDFAIATVISRDGSAPRGPGAKMLVQKDGRITGTIGGGLVEAEVIKSSLKSIQHHISVIRKFILSDEKRKGLDMTCGGEARVVIQYIDSSVSEYKTLFRTASSYTTDGDLSGASAEEQPVLVTDITMAEEGGSEEDPLIVKVFLRLTSEKSCDASEPYGSFLKDTAEQAAAYRSFSPEPNRVVICEAIGRLHCVYICGAGHVGLKTAEAADLAGFETVIIDDRSEFADKERFPFAADVRVVAGYEGVFDRCRIGPRGYIVILTRGHSFDQHVLRQALKTDAGYIGMIGSRSKIKKIYDNLKAEGVTSEQLEKVYAPIGLPIGAETPAEIAVSIAAQLIQVKMNR